MSKITQRLLVFFIGLPIVVLLVTWNIMQFLPLQIAIVVASGIASMEVYDILKGRLAMQPRFLVLALTLMITITAALAVIFNMSRGLITYFFTVAFMLCTLYEVFFADKKVENRFVNSIAHISSTVFILLYAGLLISYVSRMTVWEHPSINLGVFILLVYGCDSTAWFFGMTMGKNNRGVLAVSPNKSLAGFIGGFIGSIVVGLAARFIFPDVFIGSIFKMLLLSTVTAFAAILGDLAESALKRSGLIKDSGNVIPGRGGMMDSIDSVLFAAPVYYFLAILLYNFN